MSRWWLVIALLLSVGLNVGILAAIAARKAGPPPPAREGRPPQEGQNPANVDPVPRLGRLADRLKLEGDQRRKFLDIQWNLYQETTRQRLQLNEVHRELRRELTRSNSDRQRVEALLGESSRIYVALERALVNSVLSTRELLGPEKEKEYLRIVGRLRVPNPGPGIANPGGPPPQRRQGGFLDRFRQRRMERLERREGPPPPPEGEGDGEGPPLPEDQRPEGEGPPPPLLAVISPA